MAIFRVWTKDKYRGKLISANKLDEMLMKIKTKFELGMDCAIKLVLSDGCEIDDDDSFQTLENVDLYFLQNDEELNIPGPSSTNASNPATLIDLVKKIRQKKTGLNDQGTQVKKRRTSAKLNIGWMVFENHKYTQVRTQKGGGTRTVDFPLDSTYDDVKEKAKDFFFPNGISKKGNWENFSSCLGDFKQNILKAMDFTVGHYIKQHYLTTKPRVYLMSKPLDQSLNDDWDLPELDSLSADLNDVPSFDEISDESNSPEVHELTDVPVPVPEPFENESTLPSPTLPSPVVEPPDVIVADSSEDSVIIVDMEETLPLSEHAYPSTNNSSPVSITLPRIPSCEICTDRYCDSFLECGHILCFVCASELEERGNRCHICRKPFSKILKLYY